MQTTKRILSVPPKNLKRITSYVQPEVAEALEQWAQKEERSVSWLSSKLIEKGIEEWQQSQNKTEQSK